jgi:hypothetical protein
MQINVHCQEEFQLEGTTEATFNQGPRVVLMRGTPESILQRCSGFLMNGKEIKVSPRHFRLDG